MNKKSKNVIRIASAGTKAAVTRDQKEFNTLIKKLETERLRLAAWKDAMAIVASRAGGEYHVIEQECVVHQRKLAMLLDHMYDHKSLSKKDRVKLADLISSLALDVLDEEDDPDMKDIYNRYSGDDFDEIEAEGGVLFKDMMQDMFGLEVEGDVDFRSPEAMLEALAEQMASKGGQHAHNAKPQGSARAQSKSALAREQREAAEKERLQQSVREIFRKLVSQLHPDRELDPAERQRKTALMQRVNGAYTNNDLLGLLELQLEVEQLDQAGLDKLSGERIKQYNKILTGQLRELEREIAFIEHSAEMEVEWTENRRLTPQLVLRCIEDDIDELRRQLANLVNDIDEFADIAKLKAFLKHYRPPPDEDIDDMLFY